jgi:hypothetical protein
VARSEPGLAEVRRTLDGPLGRPVPVAWDDARYALVATGRAPLSGTDREPWARMRSGFRCSVSG